jgi:uncharacterized protein YhfF
MDLSEAKAKYPGSEVFRFGDSEELCDELTSLVISGIKVATCDALSVYESGKEKFPRVGRVDIALTWDGNPAVAIRTIGMNVVKFKEVDEIFALAEGENSDLEGWQKDHREYFERNGGYDPEMKLVCERFEVVEVFG